MDTTSTTRFFSVPEAAAEAGVTRRTVLNWIEDWGLRSHQFGRFHFVRPADLKSFLLRRPPRGRPPKHRRGPATSA